MIRLTRTVSLLGAGAIALALTACSGSGDSEYCDLITSAQEDSSLADADPTDPAAMEQLTSTFREVADAAPSDIQEDWNAVADAWEAIDVEDPASIDEETFASVDESLDNIATNVQEECDIELQ